MNLKLELFVLLTTTWMCEGSLSLLGGILSTAHEHIHSSVQDVAGTILGGINKGFNLNFEAHAGVNQQKQPGYGYGPPQGPQNEFRPNNNAYENNYGQNPHGYRPNQNGFQQPSSNNQRPNSPNYNEYNRPNQNENQDYNYGNEHQRYPNNPNYDNNNQEYPSNGQYGYNNQRYPNNQNYHNNNNYPTQGYPNNQNYPNNNGYNNQNTVNKPNFGNTPINGNPHNNGYDSTQGHKYPNILSTTSPIPELTSTSYTTEVNKVPEDDNEAQKPSDNDVPLFIPLGPNEYVYGGDRINVTDPKRHAENKPQPAEEEDFPIDIRFKDE